MFRSALLLIDVQRSFLLRGYAEQPERLLFEQRLLALVAHCEQRQIPLVDIFHVEAEGPFSLASGMVSRLPFLQHQPALTVHKHVHNAFTDSGLDRWLRERDINQVIISGIRTEQCCETSARVASDLGYRVKFVSEATLTTPLRYGEQTFSVAELRQRTCAVLAGRFADICSVEDCFHCGE
ncbi:hydrolase [Erwinia sp. OLTSP20]|uniref:cysteine hydrolase family protein n=1 Tax=unclassified Erwinia TaxID=2622719 RepID=UPI000C181EFC|nr:MULTISPECIES: isochorismatase family protein [unclassified Erwinia]PIJ50712.1 hydrolase [Erwinia sp. OAMSP11]PIJ75382.1 hydrolase [Erwinia sp. OLSSP12]PIJ81880.1 hydrolase [Erwinia sp. OLCASP19]PIJ84535.1 hydrolase [Erwinia sp. OLMTSP26]PIJ86882.1 hydrolase [Erwinia sp. OLMDSP33]